MSELTIWTYDWVPEGPRGFVRDLRLRWACEEAGLPYDVRTVPFDGRETNHLAHQPFGQVPFLSDGELEIFESGAGLLHLARKSDKLMPRDAAGEAETLQWTIAALNSIEMVTVPWWFLKMSGDEDNELAGWMGQRLGQLERVLGEQAMARGRALHRRRPADGGCAARFRGPLFRRPAGDRGLRDARNRTAPHSRRPVPTRLRISRRPTKRERITGRTAQIVCVERADSIELHRPSPPGPEILPAERLTPETAIGA